MAEIGKSLAIPRVLKFSKTFPEVDVRVYALEEMLKIPPEERDYIDRARIFFAKAAADSANLMHARSVKESIVEFGKRNSKD